MDNPDIPYEVYREVFFVTEWKDGAIYTTHSQGAKWCDPAEIAANRTKETNLIYAPMSTTFTGPTIRRKTA